MLVLGILAFLVEGADNPPDPVLVPAGDDTGAPAGDATSPEALRPLPGREEALSLPPSSTPPPSVEDRSTTTSPPAPPAPSGSRAGAGAASLGSPAPQPTEAPPPPARRPLAGFDEIAFRISRAGGSPFDGVALLAADRPSRSQGLMGQTDLRGYDGMIFRFPEPSQGAFHMRNTLIPLSIAFFDAGGRFVSSVDMEPCPDDVERCPTYGATGTYLHAIEVPQGGLGRLGIGPGSMLSFPG